MYDKAEGKTKNDYFQDMLIEVPSWGIKPAFVTGDSGYGCVSNLKPVKKHQVGLMFALESNRLVSLEKGVWAQVQKLTIPEEGLVVWLKAFGKVKLSTMSVIDNCYCLQRELFKEVIAEFVKIIMPTMAHFNPKFLRPVNA